MIRDNPIKFQLATLILPWAAATGIFRIAFPEAILSLDRLVVWATLGVYLGAVTIKERGQERTVAVVRKRKISGVGAVVIPCVFAAAFYALGHFGV